jgi:hypothetical protein
VLTIDERPDAGDEGEINASLAGVVAKNRLIHSACKSGTPLVDVPI